MAHAVGPKGQVVIEKRIREQLGIEPGWQTLQRVIEGHLEIVFIRPEHNRSLRGILAGKSKVRIGDSEEDWQRALDTARQAMARDAMGLGPIEDE